MQEKHNHAKTLDLIRSKCEVEFMNVKMAEHIVRTKQVVYPKKCVFKVHKL